MTNAPRRFPTEIILRKHSLYSNKIARSCSAYRTAACDKPDVLTSSAAIPPTGEGGAVNNGSFSSHINARVPGDIGLCGSSSSPSSGPVDEAVRSLDNFALCS